MVAVLSKRYLAWSGMLVRRKEAAWDSGIAGNLRFGIVAFGAKFVGEDRNVLGGPPDPDQLSGRKSVRSISALSA